ncbi:MAG: hypothetical protein ABEJ84_04160 [Halodesulfurarchaeum sp.]
MFESPWQIGILLGIVSLYALFLFRFAHRRLAQSQATPQPESGHGEESPIVCPECGTRNGAGYRFCRSCIAELPQPEDSGHQPGHELSRNAR